MFEKNESVWESPITTILINDTYKTTFDVHQRLVINILPIGTQDCLLSIGPLYYKMDTTSYYPTEVVGDLYN